MVEARSHSCTDGCVDSSDAFDTPAHHSSEQQTKFHCATHQSQPCCSTIHGKCSSSATGHSAPVTLPRSHPRSGSKVRSGV